MVLLCLVAGCSGQTLGTVPAGYLDVSYEELVRHDEKYNGQKISVVAVYLAGVDYFGLFLGDGTGQYSDICTASNESSDERVGRGFKGLVRASGIFEAASVYENRGDTDENGNEWIVMTSGCQSKLRLRKATIKIVDTDAR